MEMTAIIIIIITVLQSSDKLSGGGWTASDVYDVLQLLACIRTDRLQHLKNST